MVVSPQLFTAISNFHCRIKDVNRAKLRLILLLRRDGIS